MDKINELIRGLDEITLMLTDKCTMRCHYCFEHQRDTTKDKMMSLDVLNETLKLISNSNTEHLDVQLFGGEPTMNIPALYRICEWLESSDIKPHQIHIEMQSNLFNITDEHITLLKRMNDAKNVCKMYLVTSLDGIKEANIHRVDSSGNNTFDVVMSNIYRIRESIPNIYIGVHTVYSNENIKYLAQNIDFFIKLKKDGIIDQIGGNWVDPNTSGFDISEESINIACEQYWNHIQPKYNDLSLEDINMILLMRLDILVGEMNNKERKGDICGAGTKTLAVMSNGDIVPCHRYIEKHVKNINHPIVIANVLNLGKFNDEVTKIYPPLADNLTCSGIECSKCKLLPYCKTCVAANEMYGGSMNNQTNGECNRVTKLLKYTIPYKIKYELAKQRQLQNEQIELLNQINDTMINVVEGIIE